MFVISTGNLGDGFKLHGPFKDEHEGEVTEYFAGTSDPLNGSVEKLIVDSDLCKEVYEELKDETDRISEKHRRWNLREREVVGGLLMNGAKFAGELIQALSMSEDDERIINLANLVCEFETRVAKALPVKERMEFDQKLQTILEASRAKRKKKK